MIGNGRFTVDGELYVGRPEIYEGAHALGYNGHSIGICLIGNLDESKPTEKQLKTLFDFLIEKIEKFNIPIENVLGHNEINPLTSCPGKNLDMNYIRNCLKSLKSKS